MGLGIEQITNVGEQIYSPIAITHQHHVNAHTMSSCPLQCFPSSQLLLMFFSLVLLDHISQGVIQVLALDFPRWSHQLGTHCPPYSWYTVARTETISTAHKNVLKAALHRHRISVSILPTLDTLVLHLGDSHLILASFGCDNLCINWVFDLFDSDFTTGPNLWILFISHNCRREVFSASISLVELLSKAVSEEM